MSDRTDHITCHDNCSCQPHVKGKEHKPVHGGYPSATKTPTQELRKVNKMSEMVYSAIAIDALAFRITAMTEELKQLTESFQKSNQRHEEKVQRDAEIIHKLLTKLKKAGIEVENEE